MAHTTTFEQQIVVAVEGVKKPGDVLTVEYHPGSPSSVSICHADTRPYQAGTATVLKASKPHMDKGRRVQWLTLETVWDNV